MYKWIKIMLLSLILGMGYQAIDSATTHGYPMPQDQSYVASDAGVPCMVAISVAAAETTLFQRPYFMHPCIHAGATLNGIVAITETVERGVIPKDYGYRINAGYASTKLNPYTPYRANVPSYKDFHINWCS